MSKLCTKCKIGEALSDQSWCRSCKNLQKKEKRLRDKQPQIIVPEEHRLCTICNIFKSLIEFDGNRRKCKSCRRELHKDWSQKPENKEKQKQYRSGHKKEEKERSDRYYRENRETILARQKIRRASNKAARKTYELKYKIENPDKLKASKKKSKQKNAEKNRVYQNKYEKDKRKKNLAYRLHTSISAAIRAMLTSQGSSKKGSSKKYLPWTKSELMEHINKCFAQPGNEWMNWNNHGTYKVKNWDDNDTRTWTWQLDHIIPRSDLTYTSMKDENFKKCWELSNLRPLSAKQNLLDGANKLRHKS